MMSQAHAVTSTWCHQ